MIIIVGASASGKTEVAKVLFHKFNYHKCVTTTTREPRVHEVDGIDYHFLDVETFENNMKKDLFVEVTKYHNNYYGTAKADIDNGAIVIVDPSGANELIKKLDKEVYVVLIESSGYARKNRMLMRKDDISSINKRLETDDVIFNFKNLKRIDLLLINNDVGLVELAEQIHQNYHQYMKKI